MKKNNFHIIMMLPIFWMSPQVYSQDNTGIGTVNPQAKLHIDGSSNNSVTGVPTVTQQADDFVVLSNGNVGVGTIVPSVNLEVKSTGTVLVPKTAVKINDGTEDAGKVMTTDANGNTFWKYVAVNEVKGVLDYGVDVPLDAKTYYPTLHYIVLAPGKWRVNVTMLLRTLDSKLPSNAWSFVRSTFAEGSNTSTTMSADVEQPSIASGMFEGPYKKFGLLTGSVIINNKSAANKRYWYIVGNTDSGNVGPPGSIKFDLVGSYRYSENIITAFPIL